MPALAARGHGHVLVADDDAGIRAFLTAALESAGYHVTEAVNGAQALRAIGERCPDLLLLDLAMPVMDGWQVQAHLRQGGWSLPVVFMSAGYDAREEARRHHADGYLNKPFDMDDLLNTVATTLRPHSNESRDACPNG